MELSESVMNDVKEKASKVEPEIRDKFDNLYNSWAEFRKKPSVRLSANPGDYCKTESFGKIT